MHQSAVHFQAARIGHMVISSKICSRELKSKRQERVGNPQDIERHWRVCLNRDLEPELWTGQSGRSPQYRKDTLDHFSYQGKSSAQRPLPAVKIPSQWVLGSPNPTLCWTGIQDRLPQGDTFVWSTAPTYLPIQAEQSLNFLEKKIFHTMFSQIFKYCSNKLSFCWW